MLADSKTCAFILGCERSGSTWLANVIDAHSQVEFFMEPFAEFADFFPGLPRRFVYLEADRDGLGRQVRNAYAELSAAKRLFFYRLGRGHRLQSADDCLARGLDWLGQRIRYWPRWLRRYKLLHLHRSAISVRDWPKKNSCARAWVTKELRLNFKVRFLAETFPQARYVVAIRHPGAQIGSIIKYFQRQGLGELAQILGSFATSISDGSRFSKYREILVRFDLEQDLFRALAVWWLIHYDVLLDDLRCCGLEHEIVYHEEMSECPEDVASRVFQMLDLKLEDHVCQYIRESSQTTPIGFGPVNTTRNSARYYKEAIGSVPEELHETIRTVASHPSLQGALDARLEEYLHSLYGSYV